MIIGITGNIGSGKDTVAKMIQYYFAEKNHFRIFGERFEISYKLDEFLSGKDIYNEIHKINYSYTESISQDSGWQIKKFAAKLKQICAIILGCKESDFEYEEFKNSELPKWLQPEYVLLDTDDSFKQLTIRWLLQRVGTEAMRNNIHKNIWIESLFSDYKCNENNGSEICDENCIMPNWIISDLRFLNEAKAVKDRDGIILKLIRNQNFKDEHTSETELNSIIPDFEINNNGTIQDLYEKVTNFLKTFNL